MVRGLSKFREYFSEYPDSYILIGGCACDLNLEEAALEYRTTRDLDIVLCADGHDRDFFRVFWRFVKDGRYKWEKSSGEKTFYRFHSPGSEDFPSMLELFSRRPEDLELSVDAHLTPIPVDDEISSLSAILLDDDYYHFLRNNRIVRAGLSVASPAALIVLKAKAWMDLNLRRQKRGTRRFAQHKEAQRRYRKTGSASAGRTVGASSEHSIRYEGFPDSICS